MSYREPAPAALRRARRPLIAGLVSVGVTLAGVFTSCQSPAAWTPRSLASSTASPGADAGVANLDPDLRDAVREATSDAAEEGVELRVNSGWRSAAHQERLFREAVSEYGSAAQAAQWVATPEKSAHVSGDAVDIGPSEATAWLSEHGAAYGLCQIYDNEPWHFELRPGAVDHGCPARYADPTHDPRMQR